MSVNLSHGYTCRQGRCISHNLPLNGGTLAQSWKYNNLKIMVWRKWFSKWEVNQQSAVRIQSRPDCDFSLCDSVYWESFLLYFTVLTILVFLQCFSLLVCTCTNDTDNDLCMHNYAIQLAKLKVYRVTVWMKVYKTYVASIDKHSVIIHCEHRLLPT